MSGRPDGEQPLEPQLEDVIDAVRSSEGEPQDAEKVDHDTENPPASPRA